MDAKGETGETFKHKFVPFAVSNDEHVDENDVHDRYIWEEILQKSENKPYVERMMKTTGLGNPTTCGYFHIWNDRSAKVNFEVEQFFECSGLGVALMISDNFIHSFLAYVFSHKMTLCLLFCKLSYCYLWSNTENIFNLFAWGLQVKGGRRQGR